MNFDTQVSTFFTNLLLICFLLLGPSGFIQAQQSSSLKLARIKYRGGGDWYNDPSSLKNLAEFANSQIPVSINPSFDDVALGSNSLSDYPFAYMTGHGTVKVNDAELENLRNYLNNGGFLYIDDDYGLDKYVQQLVKKLYPKEKFAELPFQHPVYHQLYDFPNGLPKVHEHDGKPPQGFGIFKGGRLVLFYTYESNLSDGWANQENHHDPSSIRQEALQMGTNILLYALMQGR